ncbi:MAG: hypothetical protein LBR62_00175 [Puniceicoccales bacterium]|jgi:hypothetical protein|nr:hypothetical protein [Puniceicoccales bacterium]
MRPSGNSSESPVKVSSEEKVFVPLPEERTESEEEKMEEELVEKESEPVYLLDEFPRVRGEKRGIEDRAPPPPSFKEALGQISTDISSAFSRHLHGKFVGVWPLSKKMWKRDQKNPTQDRV